MSKRGKAPISTWPTREHQLQFIYKHLARVGVLFQVTKQQTFNKSLTTEKRREWSKYLLILRDERDHYLAMLSPEERANL